MIPTIVTVSTASSHGLAVGFPIDIRATQDNVADGAFVVDTVVGVNTFTFKLSYASTLVTTQTQKNHILKYTLENSSVSLT